MSELAGRSGIDVVGFADASEFKGYALRESCRRDPKLSLPAAKSIFVGGIYIGGVTLPAWQDPWYGRTSRLYLSGYFLDMVNPLKPLVHFLNSQGFETALCDGTTDESSILPLKLAAIRAGLSEETFNRKFDRLNTGYTFDIFQRNVLLALGNARRSR